ncbi:MAG: DHH family phosphoesterase [Bacteroidales bacterium]|nr:DHH family phosphoesterase [Bacteroidales bacterium]
MAENLTQHQRQQLLELLSTPKNIAIVTHANPDGDAIGSSLAMYRFLQKKQHQTTLIVPNRFPDFLAWLPQSDEIQIVDREPKKCKNSVEEADLIICLDFNAIDRVERFSKTLGQAKAPKLLIDHHLQPEYKSFDYVISTINISSTAELLYDFIHTLGFHDLIDKQIAESIYVGMMTDTGSFSYACNYEKTFIIVADLIKTGIDVEEINTRVYDNYSESRMRLLGFCLSERLVVLREYNTAYIYLTAEDLKRFNYQRGDTEGVVNYTLSLKGVNLGVLITQREGKIRLSMRSKGDFSVNRFAREHFQGGGHKNAAGGDSYLSMEETIRKFEEILPLYQEALAYSV